MNEIELALSRLARQEQFLEVVDRDEATARFHQHLQLRPLGAEIVPLSQALGRVLAQPWLATGGVPGLGGANVDGLALRADDMIGPREQTPRRLRLNQEIRTAGREPRA